MRGYGLRTQRAERHNEHAVVAAVGVGPHAGENHQEGGSGGRRGLPMYEVRCWMYDLGSSRAVRLVALVVVIFDVYKHGYQSIRAFPLLIGFPQMSLP